MLLTGNFFERALGSVHCWWGLCLFCAGIQVWANRYSMNPDGLSYLDIGSNAASGGPYQLVNGYWSPGYPALIGIAIFLFRPSPYQEVPLVHVVNFLIFILTLWAFSVFFRNWLASTSGDLALNESTRRYVTPFAFSAFLWFMSNFIEVDAVSPDLGVAAIAFLAAGIGCRLSLPMSRWKHYVALGFVLGLGYYVKAAMLPLGLALLALLFLLLPLSSGITRSKLLQSLSLSFTVFLLVAAPLLVAMSDRAGTPSFGAVSRLNYAWLVNGLQIYTGWTGGDPDVYGTPEHPPRKLMGKPLVLEFGSPIKGTFPLWYDPSYWYAGAKAHFDLRQQIAAVIRSMRLYRDIAFETIAYIAGAMVLWVLGSQEKLYPAVPRNLWWQPAWALAAFSMYALVHVERRFLGAFFALFWLAIYGILIPRVNRRVALAICATVLLTVMVPFMTVEAEISVSITRDLAHPRPPEYETAGLGLRELGLKNGDRLALVGYPFDCYYARFARLHVVAQIPDTQEFWRLSPPELKLVAERLASIGVKAVVAWNRPDTSAFAGWKDVKVSDSSRLSVLLLTPGAPGIAR